MMPGPMVLADLGGFVAIAIFVISILSWIVNLIKGAGGGPNVPRPPAAQPPAKNLQQEIMEFLQEMNQAKAAAAKPAEPPPRPQKAQQKPQKQKPPKPKPKPQPQAEANRERPGTRLAGQHLSSSNLGAGIGEHLSTHMAEGRVRDQAERDVGSRVAAAVARDLGTEDSQVPPGQRAENRQHPIVAQLLSPGGIRQAMILNEILQRPKALRGVGDRT